MFTCIQFNVFVYIYTLVYFILQFVAVAAILNVMPNAMLTTATLDCTLPCFSPGINCSLSSIAPNNSEVMITHDEIMGSTMSYSYPTQQIMISNLANNTRHDYCVVAIDIINNITVGNPVCGNFTTAPGIAMDLLLLCTCMD